MENALKFHWWRIVRPVWPKRGLVSFDGLRRWLVRLLGDLQFADLKSPCTIVATDLELGVPVELNEGRVAPAVQASCSIPGFVAPVELDGRLLCDGGISDMLPVSVLRKMGADYVIAVDIFPFKLRSYLGPLGHFWAALEILFERAGGGIGAADCLIAPDLCGYSYLSLSKRKELDELGRQAASEKLECIRQALGMNHANKPVPAVKELQL